MKTAPELVIGMKEARTRLNHELCLNCGQPQTNVELNSCNKPDCVAVLRPLYRWARRIAEQATGRI